MMRRLVKPFALLVIIASSACGASDEQATICGAARQFDASASVATTPNDFLRAATSFEQRTAAFRGSTSEVATLGREALGDAQQFAYDLRDGRDSSASAHRSVSSLLTLLRFCGNIGL